MNQKIGFGRPVKRMKDADFGYFMNCSKGMTHFTVGINADTSRRSYEMVIMGTVGRAGFPRIEYVETLEPSRNHMLNSEEMFSEFPTPYDIEEDPRAGILTSYQDYMTREIRRALGYGVCVEKQVDPGIFYRCKVVMGSRA